MQLDLLGVTLVTVAAVLVIYPLVQGRELGWPWWCFAMIAGGPTVFAAFIAYKRATRRAAVIEASLLANRDQDTTAMTPRKVAGADQDHQAVIDREREQARQAVVAPRSAVLQRQAAEQARAMERHTRTHDYDRSHGPHRPGPDREGLGLGM